MKKSHQIHSDLPRFFQTIFPPTSYDSSTLLISDFGLSFKVSVDAVRHYSQAFAQARTEAKANRLLKELPRVLASDLAPARPGRKEPRVVKRCPNPVRC